MLHGVITASLQELVNTGLNLIPMEHILLDLEVLTMQEIVKLKKYLTSLSLLIE